MGHQVNFFVLPADLPAIEAVIRATGDVTLLADRTPTRNPAELATLAFQPDEKGGRGGSGEGGSGGSGEGGSGGSGEGGSGGSGEGGSGMGSQRFRVYIARRSDLGAVKTRFVSTQGYWLIDSTDSPVIEFDRCLFDGQELKRGRAYFASDLRFRRALPSPEFVKWGDRVLARIKKVLIREPEVVPGCYVSAAALAWIRENNASASGGMLKFRSSGG